jgi:transposase
MRRWEVEGLSILEICNSHSISAYEKETERQKNLGIKVDYLFRWLTLLVATFNVLISFAYKFFDSEEERCLSDGWFRLLL